MATAAKIGLWYVGPVEDVRDLHVGIAKEVAERLVTRVVRLAVGAGIHWFTAGFAGD